jgi:SPOR domain
MDRERDPIAELARLIAEADPYGESAAAGNSFRKETASARHDEPPGSPPAPQLPADTNAPEQAHELDEYGHDDRAYDVDDRPYTADEEYQTEVPRVRRRSLTLMIAIAGLALGGTAGAFGYREIFRGSVIATPPPIITASNEPNKLAPASSAPQAKNSGNARQDGADTTGSIEKMVSREEQPVTIVPPKPTSRVISTIPITMRQDSLTRVGPPAAPAPVVTQAVPSQGMSGRAAAVADPSPQSAGPSSAGDVTAALNSAHLAAAPIPPANANSGAAVTPSVLGGGYAVQVTSERSESSAQAAFRVLQAKYPQQLGGRQAIIRRADLGASGTYYRAVVGPLRSAEEAKRLCSGLKAAGADCIIQKN